MTTDVTAKPRLRGVSHHVAFYAAAIAGTALLAMAANARAASAGAVYVVTLLMLFGISALYHRVDWSASARLVMRRLDHATIFLFIAGSYTPICLLALGEAGERLLMGVWVGAALGVARAVFWPNAPKAVSAALYVLLGWLVLAQLPAIATSLGATAVALLAAGGVLYTIGALVYALRCPDPLPATFGYHEVFHALVVLACVLHYLVIAQVVAAPVGVLPA